MSGRLRVLELLGAAFELAPAERDRFLDRECGNDRQLKDEVKRLLAREEEIGSNLSSTAPVLSTVRERSASVGDPILAGVPEVEGYKVLGPSILYEKIGQGGMGAVYHGYHIRLEIDVAVKCLLPALLTRDNGVLTRFQREARIAARITHQNLVRLFDCGEEHGLYYLVMELVRGETLRRWAASRDRVPPGDAVSILFEAASGLAAAHAEDVIHRDIKPDNLLISHKGIVKVSDLGLSRRGESDPAVTLSHAPMGSPRYMPPEQWRSIRRVGPEADVWALGASLYFLLTGEDAFSAGTLHELERRICEEPFPDVHEKTPDLAPPLFEVLSTCTRTRPEERYRSAGDLAAALRRLQEKHGLAGDPPERRWDHSGSPPAIAQGEGRGRRPPPSVLERLAAAERDTTGVAAPPPRRRRGPAAVLCAGGISLCLLAILGVWWLSVPREQEPRESSSELARREIPGFRFAGTNAQGCDEYMHEASGVLMVLLEGGSFLMGSPESDASALADEKPQWRVELSPFLIAKYELSQDLWERVMGENPAPPADRDPRLPVCNVSWFDCKEYCKKTGLSLPTEAQWEYSCRAGTTTPFAFGDVLEGRANFGGDYKKPLDVDTFGPNGYGLFNMHGNVWEWCRDAYDEAFYRKARDAGESLNPECRSGRQRVLRGGHFFCEERQCRSASRWSDEPGIADLGIGFRPAFRPGAQ